jgi:hypothetical protein
MIYYPKANITPNLFSNREYVLNGSNEPYTGYYFSTYDGKFYTGREPGDGINLELISSGPNFQGEAIAGEIDYRFVGTDNYFYSTSLKKITPVNPISLTPQPFYPKPTLADYQTGEITRYFSKKVNEGIFYETQGTFQNTLYISFNIPWLITGDKDNVAKVNQRIVALKEAELKIIGLGIYLKNNYIQFYK